jgi:hypothetical protein
LRITDVFRQHISHCRYIRIYRCREPKATFPTAASENSSDPREVLSTSIFQEMERERES